MEPIKPPFSRFQTFRFLDYDLDEVTGVLKMRYEVESKDGEKIEFEEKNQFEVARIDWSKVNQEAVKMALDAYFLMSGLSYYKAHLAEKLDLGKIRLNLEQAVFWNKLYQRGLGEFFYRNNLDFRGWINFPVSDQSSSKAINLELNERSIVPIGGGKDSVVTGEILAEAGEDFLYFSLRDAKPIRETAAVLGREKILVGREISPSLLECNAKGAWNGHVPITAQISFLLVVCSVLYDFKNLIISLEKSADFGQLVFLEEEINHQYSKSNEFEYDFVGYIKNYVSPDINYFSLLRGYYELKIAELFTNFENFKRYIPVFTSCNANFKLKPDGPVAKWCCHCPKCAFVFLLLSAFVSKKEMLEIFGENIFEKEELVEMFRELMGISGHKPFECVGTPEESMVAMYLCWERGEFEGTAAMEMFKKEVLPLLTSIDKMEKEVLAYHDFPTIPKKFKAILAKYS